MRVPLSWLRELVATELKAADLAEVLTLGGLEVEAIERPTAGTRGVVVVEVLDVARMEGSDKLSLVHASDGDTEWEIVCGASNFAPGDRVPAALPGAVLPGGIEIGRKTLFGVTSNGMLASARELGIGDDHRGIWVLDAGAPVGAALHDWLALDDEVLVLELTPDRGYALSLAGIAHDVAALTGAELTLPEVGALATDDAGVEVVIHDPRDCPRFTVQRITGVHPGRRSPAQVQHRLALAGMRPIGAVVDATNYAMLEVGQPSHAFDLPRIAGRRLEIRRAHAGERLTTLDGFERDLDPDDVIICDADGPVSLAGVMGGTATEVSDDSTEILLEAATWNPVAILRAGRRHKLTTEARTRYERNFAPELVDWCAARVGQLVTDLAGGQIVGGADHYPGPPPPRHVPLRPARVRSHLGIALSAGEQVALLERIRCTVADGANLDADQLTIVAPPYRTDLRIEADLHEEIARLYGYPQIPQRVPSTGQAGGRDARDEARRAVRRALAGAGWNEALLFPFIAEEDLERLGLPPGDRRRRAIRLVNPLSQAEAVLRTTLLPGLLLALRRNVNRGNADVALFEAGHVYLEPTGAESAADGGPSGVVLPAEPGRLGLVACGCFEAARYDRPGRAADFYDLSGAVDVVRRTVGAEAAEYEPTEQAPFHPGRAATVRVDGTEVGVIGELHPRVIAAYELPPRALAGELAVDAIVGAGVRIPAARAPSPLPALRFDVAVSVPEAVPHAAVAAAIRAAAGSVVSSGHAGRRLTELRLFDVYRGAQVGEGAKSLAFALTLDDAQVQLTDADAAAAIDAIAAAVERDLGGTLRRA